MAGVVQETAAALPDLAVGALPATPIMRWLAERGGPIERFNQAMLLQVPAGLREDHLVGGPAGAARPSRCVAAAADWSRAGRANGRLEVAPPGAVEARDCLRRVDVRGLDAERRRDCMQRAGAAAALRLAPAAGVMVQAVWFDAGAERPGRLLLTIHHLAVDGVSWRILVPDLAAAWAAIARGQEPALPPRGTSFQRWAQRLAAHAQEPARVGGAAVLDRDAERAVAASGRGRARSRRATSRHSRAVHADAAGRDHGAAAHPRAGRVPWRHQRRAADRPGGGGCGLVPAAWSRRREQAVLLDLEGHGREEVFADVDLSRTVGWFTSLFPVRLDPGRSISTRPWRVVRRSGARSSSSRSSCARCRTAGSAMGCCAISTAETARSSALCDAADRLQLPRARSRRRRRRTGPRLPRL